MRLEQTARVFKLTDAIRHHVRRRVDFAIGRFATRISRVTVRLSDVNGPRGGVDKECRIHVRLDGHGPIVVTELAEDMYASIDLACGRVGRVVARKIGRAQAGRARVLSRSGVS
jgi:ribosomal subunit interface protein